MPQSDPWLKENMLSSSCLLSLDEKSERECHAVRHLAPNRRTTSVSGGLPAGVNLGSLN